jgi:hypothetical protein
MAYWWVSQNQSYRQERTGGFLWAPDRNESGLTPFHWATMSEVRPGEVILSYVRGKISAPVPVSDLLAELQPLLPERYSPLNRFGTGNQGYLFGLPPRAGRLLLERIGVVQPDPASDVVSEGVRHVANDSTERRALVLSQVGQGQFRDRLMSLWGCRCAVTGLDLPAVLWASHIKPWRDANNRERLDPYNGLLLSPSYDAAFDTGLITFAEDGRIVLSTGLTPSRVERLGVSTAARIDSLQERHSGYLDYHRRNVFVG